MFVETEAVVIRPRGPLSREGFATKKHHNLLGMQDRGYQAHVGRFAFCRGDTLETHFLFRRRKIPDIEGLIIVACPSTARTTSRYAYGPARWPKAWMADLSCLNSPHSAIGGCDRNRERVCRLQRQCYTQIGAGASREDLSGPDEFFLRPRFWIRGELRGQATH